MKFKFTIWILSLTLSIFSQEKINTTLIDSITLENKIVYEINEQGIYYNINNEFYKKTKDSLLQLPNLVQKLTLLGVFAVLLGFSVYKGFKNGFFVEVASFVGLLVGIYFALKFSNWMGAFFSEIVFKNNELCLAEANIK